MQNHGSNLNGNQGKTKGKKGEVDSGMDIENNVRLRTTRRGETKSRREEEEEVSKEKHGKWVECREVEGENMMQLIFEKKKTTNCNDRREGEGESYNKRESEQLSS